MLKRWVFKAWSQTVRWLSRESIYLRTRVWTPRTLGVAPYEAVTARHHSKLGSQESWIGGFWVQWQTATVNREQWGKVPADNFGPEYAPEPIHVPNHVHTYTTNIHTTNNTHIYIHTLQTHTLIHYKYTHTQRRVGRRETERLKDYWDIPEETWCLWLNKRTGCQI